MRPQAGYPRRKDTRLGALLSAVPELVPTDAKLLPNGDEYAEWGFACKKHCSLFEPCGFGHNSVWMLSV
jgi:hypothetical protein